MSTANPRDSRLSIVDQETGVELAELGMEVRRKAHVCRECRFCDVSDLSSNFDKCLAKGGNFCNGLNKNSDCEFWEAKRPVVALAKVASGGMTVGLLLGTTFGGAVVGLLWLLLGGG